MSEATQQITTAELTADVSIPLIGLGTWPLTGTAATETVSQAIRNGYRHIDTAENYANEVAVGEGIRRSGIDRGHLFLTTKFNTAWHSRFGVREAFGEAVKRLGTEYLDLFLVHWPNPARGRFVEACEGLQELVDDGAIRAWGVSNFKPAHLQAVQDAGLRVPVNQVQVDPEHRWAGTVHSSATPPSRARRRLRQDTGPGRPALACPARPGGGAQVCGQPPPARKPGRL
jgi:2,5-diketo-D-gluconate reductase A